MTTDIPTGFIQQQSLTSQPVTSDATLVDDPTALVDSPTALSNGPSGILEGARTKAVPTVPLPRIKLNR